VRLAPIDTTGHLRTVRDVDIQPRRAFTLALFATFGVLGALTVWGMLSRAGFVLGLLLVSFLASAACEPLVDTLERRGVRRGTAAAVLLGAVVLLLLLGSVLAGTAAVSQFTDLRDSLPVVIADLESFLRSQLGLDVSLGWLQDRLSGAELSSVAGDLTARVLGIVGGFLAALLITFYLIVDGRRIRRAACSLLPPQHQGEVLRVWDLAVAKTGGYLVAKTTLASISAVVHALAFTLAGVPYAIPLGIWVGLVSQVIPIIGTYLALGFPVLVSLAAGSPGTAVGVLIIGTVYQQIENYVLAPRLTRNTMDLHPLAGFVGILASAAIFGPAASLLAAPVLATLQGVVSAYVTRHEILDDPRLHTGELPIVSRRGRRTRRPRH
jgi:predicted PurR-regulated permease PerM